MKRSFFRPAVIAAVVIASSITLSGCTINIGNQDPPKQGQSKQDRDDQTQMRMDAAVMFAQMMIPHHQQAVDIGTLAETRASNKDVKELAAQIKDEQAPEIELMKGWLKDAGIDSDNSMGHMHHGMGASGQGMDGMLTNDDMTALESASGDTFDRLFLSKMIAHHEGAIAMAKDYETSGDDKLAKLTKAIIKSQSEQITYMKDLLKKLS